jgi:hypothetical protein
MREKGVRVLPINCIGRIKGSPKRPAFFGKVANVRKAKHCHFWQCELTRTSCDARPPKCVACHSLKAVKTVTPTLTIFYNLIIKTTFAHKPPDLRFLTEGGYFIHSSLKIGQTRKVLATTTFGR